MSTPWRWLKLRWPIWALMGVWAWFFWRFGPWAGADQIMYMPGDFTETFWKYGDLIYRAWAAGQPLPLWCDCLWSGFPLASEPQSQLLYPPKWAAFVIVRLLGYGHWPIEAQHALVAVHALAASFGMLGFLRALQLRQGATVLGALTFAYGGFMLGYAPVNSGILMGATWMPYALWSVAGLRRDSDSWPAYLQSITLTGLCLALAFYAGHPQTFLYGSSLVLAYLLFRTRQARRPWIASLGLTGAAGLLTAGLAAAQLVVTLGLYAASQRVTLGYDAAGGGFPFVDALQLLITGVFSFWHPMYVGLLPLTLALWALGRRGGEIWFWGGAVVISLLLGFGSRAGVYDVARIVLPGWTLFRGQEKMVLITSLALSTLAAHGADRWLAPASRSDRRQLATGRNWVVGLSLAATVIALGGAYLNRLGLDQSDWRRLADRTGVMMLASGLALSAWWWRTQVAVLRRALPGMLPVLVALDAFAASRPLNIVPAYDPYPPDVLVEPIVADTGFFRVQDDTRLVGHAGCEYGYADINGRTPVVIAGYARLLATAPEPMIWSLLGVRYVVTGRDALPVPAEVVAERSQPDAPPWPADRFSVLPAPGAISRTFRLTGSGQRAWLAHEVRSLAGADAVVAETAAADFDPHVRALVAAQAGDDFETAAELPGRVELLEDHAGSLVLRVVATRTTLLVISQPYAPGWRASLDSHDVPLRPAFNSLLALSVPAGEHDIMLAYAPPGWPVGIGMTVVALLLCAGLLWAGRTSARPTVHHRSKP